MNFIFRLTFCQEFHRFFVMRLSFHKSAPCLNESQKAGDNESNKTLLKKKKKSKVSVSLFPISTEIEVLVAREHLAAEKLSP